MSRDIEKKNTHSSAHVGRKLVLTFQQARQVVAAHLHKPFASSAIPVRTRKLSGPRTAHKKQGKKKKETATILAEKIEQKKRNMNY